MYLLHNHGDSPDPSPTTTTPKLVQPFKQQSEIPGCPKGTNPAELHHWHNCQKAQSWQKLPQNPTEIQSKETLI